MEFPKIVHLMYIPWNKNQELKSNEFDFDHNYYYKLRDNNPTWTINMWTYSKLKKFVDSTYPLLWNFIWKKIKKPVQAIDFFRLLVVYYYGGVYIQYDSIIYVPLDNFVPTGKNNVKLFVEKIISIKFSKKMIDQPIRNGKPEELVRICTQLFSAYPKNDFIRYCVNKSKKNLLTKNITCDYDILYIGGNAMISEAYDEYKNKEKIELIDSDQRSKMIEFSSYGSWRTDNKYNYNMIMCIIILVLIFIYIIISYMHKNKLF